MGRDAFSSCDIKSLLILCLSEVGTRFLGVPDWSSLTQEAHVKDICICLVQKIELKHVICKQVYDLLDIHTSK